jgi:hypothetical protein
MRLSLLQNAHGFLLRMGRGKRLCGREQAPSAARPIRQAAGAWSNARVGLGHPAEVGVLRIS